MAKRKSTPTKSASKKPVSRADRTRILAEMKASGLTAKQAAKKYGVSFWTIYGWRKSRNTGKAAAPARKSAAKGSAKKSAATKASPRSRSAGSLGETLRPLIAAIVREEIARLVRG